MAIGLEIFGSAGDFCFAHQTSMTNNGSLIDSITNVPCEKVEGLITK